MLLFFGASCDLFASAPQNSISRANGDRRSQIEKHVVVSVRSNLPQKVQQSFLNQSLDPAPNQKFLYLPLLIIKEI